jgi:putative transposase
MQLFDNPTDYYAFLAILGRAQKRTAITSYAYCLMPNHFHLVCRPEMDGQLSRFMHWTSIIHSMRWHSTHGTSGTGAVYQGRFKAIPVSNDEHFLRLCRYVERNPLRAGLVSRAEAWPWSSLSQREGLRRPVRLDPWPVPAPLDWVDHVNRADEKSETNEIRQAVRRGAPYGADEWRVEMGTRLGLVRTLKPIGRPKKAGSGLVF